MEDMGIMVDDLLREEDDDLPPAMSMSPGGGSSSATSSAAAATAPAPPPAAAAAASDDDLRRGPWTVEEDALLVHHIAAHGEGRWNALARAAGLRRTGKSCRLRWLNYLRPGVRRGDITPREQLLILDLHSRWGNRWSKIATHLPGRTDNEIKNYWRTRVQKHARQMRCDVNSVRFRDVVRRVWMPRLVERIQADEEAAAGNAACGGAAGAAAAHLPPVMTATASAPPACQRMLQSVLGAEDYYGYTYSDPAAAAAGQTTPPALSPDDNASSAPHSSLTTDASSSHAPTNEGCGGGGAVGDASRPTTTDGDVLCGSWSELLATAGRDDDGDSSMSMIGLPDFGWFGDLEDSSSLWSLEDLCLHQLC